MSDPYVPIKAKIIDIVQETSSDVDIKTFRIKYIDDAKKMEFMPGQFFEFLIPGIGEAPFGFASNPLEKDYFEVSIKKTGLVTEAIHNLKIGDYVWVRGPLGNFFPVGNMANNNILIVAGGIGLAPLRPLILSILDLKNREKYNKLTMLIAARCTSDFIYKKDISVWSERNDADVILTIDNPEEGWGGRVGFPHNILSEIDIDIYNTYAITCGPPIMIKFVSSKLVEIGIPENKIYTTLEMRMACGIGKCGKCNIGHKYVCIDGPVFSMEELSKMPQEY